jgi:hypothetical protein
MMNRRAGLWARALGRDSGKLSWEFFGNESSGRIGTVPVVVPMETHLTRRMNYEAR